MSGKRKQAKTAKEAGAIPTHRFGRLRKAFRDLLLEEEKRHSGLLSELEGTRRQLDVVRSELEQSFAQVAASRSDMRLMLAEWDDIEQRLRENEATSRELLETAAQAIIVVDATGRIVRVNAMACGMFGYDRDDLEGRKLGALVPARHRRAHSGHAAGFFAESGRRRMGAGRELMGRRKDGTVFPIEVALSSVTLDHTQLAVAFVSDISSRQDAEARIAEQNERLRQLAQRLTTASEVESRKWARELHDVFSQRLVGIAMGLSQVVPETGQRPRLLALEEEVRALAQDIHNLSRRIHPNILHDLGLVAAVRSEAMAFERDCGVKIRFQARGVPARLAEDVALCLYRVVQESLRNIRKHAGASSVSILLTTRKGQLALKIRDQGDGFDLDRALRKGGLGLVSMEERVLGVGGAFSVDSTPGEGTVVRVVVPLGGRGAQETAGRAASR